MRDPDTDLPYPCEMTLHGHTIVYHQDDRDPDDQTISCLTCGANRDTSRDDETTVLDLTGMLVFSTDPGFWVDVTSDKTQPGLWPNTPFPAEVDTRDVVLGCITHCGPEPSTEGYQMAMLVLGLEGHPVEALKAYIDFVDDRDGTL